MAAETPALFSATDEELFDAERIVHTCKDTRTVGEMLHDADHLARQLLMDVTGDDAGPLLRSWPTLVDAGSRLWEALPSRGTTRPSGISPCSVWWRPRVHSPISSRALQLAR